VKKKYFLKSKDQKDWLAFTKQMGNIRDKEPNFLNQNVKSDKVKKLDLHGFSLNDANITVKKFIINAFNDGYRKLLIVTGKGLRSKSIDNPYLSSKLSTLKYSVPDYIKNEVNLNNKVLKISEANQEDGGAGAIYIFLKKKL
tara:strand:- start:3147 stop:3572 length:426 start_codon:yes stop_codon:yes gene_type:complete